MIDIDALKRDKRPQSAWVVHALIDRLEAAESDAAHQKALAESALRVAEGWEGKCGELRAALRHEADCVDAAKAKIDALPGAQPAPSVPRESIEKMLTQLMDIAVSNGANSVSMPDEYVEVAAWLCGIPARPAPSVPDGFAWPECPNRRQSHVLFDDGYE